MNKWVSPEEVARAVIETIKEKAREHGVKEEELFDAFSAYMFCGCEDVSDDS